MTDIEISKKYPRKKISQIAKQLDFDVKCLGDEIAKINQTKRQKKGKLVLVSAISPTPLGEGKTTMSIALADSLKHMEKDVILALREPSMGPVFGIKGGATGGGKCQIVPMEDINLFFTGDIPAITSANDLISSLIDNHIYQGNELGFEKVVFKRCIDLNDRALRNVDIGRPESFSITAASEIMAILCLANDLKDLKQMLNNILLGYNKENKPIYLKDLKIAGAIATVLKDAIKPNLVQTLYNTPAIVHGRPFANIAHGCNSIIATKMAMKVSDIVVTEAGFGSELGAEKFIDIKCRKANIYPDAIVLVATLKALKYHGGQKSYMEKDLESLKIGLSNLMHHYNYLSSFDSNVVIAFNHYNSDDEEEIRFLEEYLTKNNISYSFVDSYEKGDIGAIDLANKVLEKINLEKPNNPKYLYELEDSIEDKITKVATKAYGAKNITFSENAKQKIKDIKKLGYSNLPICIAKSQYALCGNAKDLNSKDVFVKDIELKTGSSFIVVYLGNIVTMPALGKRPAALDIDIDDNGIVKGIF